MTWEEFQKEYPGSKDYAVDVLEGGWLTPCLGVDIIPTERCKRRKMDRRQDDLHRTAFPGFGKTGW